METGLVAEDQPGVIEVPDAKLWTAETPYLYECRVQTPTDEKRIEIGIRSLVWSAKQGLLVNGQRVLLRGGCIHHDHGVLGACEYYDAEERRIRILKENGFNAVRIAHNPASQITLSICDRLGMYVMDETLMAGTFQRPIMTMPDGLPKIGRQIWKPWWCRPKIIRV